MTKHDFLSQNTTPTTSPSITRWAAIKRIFSLAIPMAIAYTFSFSVVIIGILSGHLSDEPTHLAATTLIMVTMNTLVIIGLSPLLAITIKASNHIGQLRALIESKAAEDIIRTKQDYIANINKSSLLVGILTLPILFALIFSKPLLVFIFGQEEGVAAIVSEFLIVYSIAYPAIIVRVCFEQMMFSFAHVKPAMVIGFISFLIGTFFAVVLAFGSGPFPMLGLTGIAIGYIIDAYLTAIGFGLYLALCPSLRSFHFFQRIWRISKLNLQQARDILTIGLPIAFTISNEMLIIFIIGILAGLVGTTELAAFNYAMQFVLFTFIAFAAFGNAACQEVSRELGAKCFANANRIAKYALVATVILVLPICVLISLYPNIVIFLSGSELETSISTIFTLLMPLMALAVLFDAIRFNLLLVLRALHDHIISTSLSTVALWLGILLALLLTFVMDFNIYGVAIGYAFGFILATVLLSFRWWKRITIDNMKSLKHI